MTRNHWPFLPLGRIYSSPLASLRAFWSLEPQAYLVKTYIRQKHAAKPQFMMHKQIIRPHFAVSSCCTGLSSHGDLSWIQYEAPFLLSMKSQEQIFYCSYLLQMHHISSRTCSYFPVEKSGGTGVISLDMSRKSQDVRVRSPRLFEHNFLKAVCRTEISEIEGSCKVYGRETNWKTNWKLRPLSLASKKWGALEAWQMTPIRAAFIYLFQSMWRYHRRFI